MAISREEIRQRHTAEMGHDQFSETIYGVICATCHNYVLIDRTNCPSTLPRARNLPRRLRLEQPAFSGDYGAHSRNPIMCQ